MRKEKKLMRLGGVCFLTLLFALSLCFDLAADPNPSNRTSKPKITQEEVQAAFETTHYALYYANKELRKWTYLDPAYDRLNDVFNRAERSWYKGQYHLDLVTCGEITDENEVQVYLHKALRYFNKTKAYADWVYNRLPAGE